MLHLPRKALLLALVALVVTTADLIAGGSQAASKDPGRSLGHSQAAAVAPNVSSNLTSTTYTFSTAVSEINCGFNEGWWTAGSATNEDCNTNYLTGNDSAFGYVNGGYAMFDITSTTNPCMPASAYLSVPAHEGSHVFYGSGPTSASLGLFDVATAPVTLAEKDNNPNAVISTDLRGGTMYGGPYTLPTTTTSGTFTLNLNSAGLNGLQQAKLNGRQYFSIGMGLIGAPDHTWLFGFSGGEPITLTVMYPKLCRVA
jgi:hypothetical protein